MEKNAHIINRVARGVQLVPTARVGMKPGLQREATDGCSTAVQGTQLAFLSWLN